MKLHHCLLATCLLVGSIAGCTHPPVDPKNPLETQPGDLEEADEFGLKTTDTKASVVNLVWKAQPGNPTYRILRLTVESSDFNPATAPYTSLGETTASTFEDNTVLLGTAYYYKIQARYTTGKVVESDYISCHASSGPNVYKLALEAYTKLGAATGGKRYNVSQPSLLPATIIKILNENIGNQPADVVILLDNTGSMSGYIDSCRAGLNKIIDALPANTRLGAGGYRDHGDTYVLRYQDLTTNFASIRTFLAGMTASGGGDLPEAVYDAVYGVVTQAKWTNKKRIVIVVGDAPPHDEPGMTDHHYQEVVDKCRQAGINVNLFPILIDSNGNDITGND